MKINLNAKAETVLQPVFELYGIVYLPDYAKKHRWVGPGSPELRQTYTSAELHDSGATKKSEMLWPRSWTHEVSNDTRQH